MTACEREREAIGALVDSQLGAAERAALEAHLAGCAGCRKALAELEGLATAFETLRPVEPPADFEARFWARIAREKDAPQGLRVRLRRWLVPGGLALAGAVAALVLFLNLPAPESRGPAATARVEPPPAAEPAPALARAPIESDTDRRILTNARDVELLRDPDIDAISEVDLLEDWDDAGPG